MSSLQYKHDWDETKEQWSLWWKRQAVNGPLLGIQASRGQASLAPAGTSLDSDYESRWLNSDDLLARVEDEFARTVYIGGTFPYTWASLGPGSMGTFLGAEPVFESTTVWYKPCFSDIRASELVFDRKSRWWQWTVEVTQKAVEQSRNRYLIAIPDMVENLDTLAALLGTEKLLYYLSDCPQEVHRLQKQLLPLWFEAFDELYELIKEPEGGNSFAFFQIWAPGRMAKLQCDFSAMISPHMFAEFVLPYLKEQCDRLDYSLYHLDGPRAVCHLDHLLSISSLDCIQWTPGEGQPGGSDPCWDEIYRKTLEAGKCIHVSMAPEEVRPFVKRLSTSNLYICTSVETESEGKELLATVQSG